MDGLWQRGESIHLPLMWAGYNASHMWVAGMDLGGGCKGCAPLPEIIYGFLIQLVFCKKMWFIGVSYAIS